MISRRVLALLVAVLAVASLAAFLAYRRFSGAVAVVEIKGYILTGEDADYYTDLLLRAYRDDWVKAVVLVVDSFGGSADYVEQVYYNVKQVKQRKPVVALAVNALSGGYYVCVAADYIYAHPTSLVGSVGVIATAPPLLVPSERVLETGAYKHTGFSRLNFFSDLRQALESFVSAVEEGRGSRLKAAREELLKARVYLGREALELGLVDQLGSLQQAVDEAARRAGLLSYTVVRLNASDALQRSAGYTWRNVTVPLLETLHPPPAIYYIYIPAVQVASPGAQVQFNASGKGRVLVDLSHGNRVSWWSLDALLAELVRRNVSVGFVSSWRDLESELSNATALVVAAPARPYSRDEVDEVEQFVRRGGVLLLLYDPSYEYLGAEGFSNLEMAPANSIASRFGVTFAYGYLYNNREYYGIYRNIYVRDFANETLFRNVTRMVLFTAAAVRSSSAAAWAPEGTYSTAAEATGRYAVAAVVRWGNGTVVALGDITLFSEPFCRVEDNHVFIENLASLMANATLARAQAPRAGERVERPNLPVGTVKLFEVWEDGETYELRWTLVSENETLVETPYGTTRYLYTEGGLKAWEHNGMLCIYDEPLPEPPFPLTRGSSWSYSTGFTIRLGGETYRGRVEGREEVEGFETITALDGRSYFCARVRFELRESLGMQGVTALSTTRGYYCISSEAGTVKQSYTVSQARDSTPLGTTNREMLLKELREP